MASPSPIDPPSRRELTRQYKDARRPAGVYAIRNTSNGRLLVGASLNLEGALNRHRFELKQHGHRNRALQQDWGRLGADSFSFEIIDTLRERDDPAFDYQAELVQVLEMWRAELLATATSYDNREVQP